MKQEVDLELNISRGGAPVPLADLTPQEVRHLRGKLAAALIRNHRGGRKPAADRCLCGLATAARVRAGFHKCRCDCGAGVAQDAIEGKGYERRAGGLTCSTCLTAERARELGAEG